MDRLQKIIQKLVNEVLLEKKKADRCLLNKMIK